MARPRIVALYTDYGSSDARAGVLRGVVTSLAPEAEVLDVCHGVPPGDLCGAAYRMLCAVPFLPRGTIHVCDVARRGVASRTVAVRAGGHTLLAADDGVLAPVIEALGGAAEARVVTNEKLQRPRRGDERGRDVMGPVAAHLLRGIEFALVGAPAGPLAELPEFAPRADGDRVVGRVLDVDAAGRVVTSFVEGDLPGGGAAWMLRVGATDVPVAGGDGPASALVAEPGSGQFIVIDESGGRTSGAAARLGCARGDAVTALWRIA
ncbi:MAG: 5'-fluoro-5'-deoxy-adenosine synthase [Planctomycetes bacterium]|nr:5'-fluoro-5'-deoxy-adenosine synthase [Planctomycetota bacterium]